MSNAADQKLLDEYLRGDSSYSELYRTVEADDVPSELDRDVLTEARAAIASRSSARRKRIAWQRFTPMLAVAATTVLTISIVMRSERPGQPLKAVSESQIYQPSNVEVQSVDEAPVLSDFKAERTVEAPPNLAPAPSFKRRQVPAIERPNSAAPAAPSVPAPVLEADNRSKEPYPTLDQVEVRGAVPRSNPQDAALPVSVITQEKRRLESRDRVGPRESVPVSLAKAKLKTAEMEEAPVAAQVDDKRIAAGPRGTITPSPLLRADLREVQRLRESTPTAWLNYILELRNAGKNREADREWERFVKAFPNFIVEPDAAVRPKKAQP